MAIYEGGTGSANKLDDYEEGTWTPNPHGYWSGGWRQATYTGTVEGATYTKIGRTVYFKCYFNNCLLYTSPSPRDLSTSRMPSSA